MEALAGAADRELRIYMVGGTTAVLMGWRSSTIDVDLVMRPEDDALLLRAIPAIKERLQVNIELTSPLDFIPVLPGWEDRSPPIARIGRVSFHHCDFYAQALAKLERGHWQDVADVRAMVARGLVVGPQLLAYFGQIGPDLYHYPALDPPSFRRAGGGGSADSGLGARLANSMANTEFQACHKPTTRAHQPCDARLLSPLFCFPLSPVAARQGPQRATRLARHRLRKDAHSVPREWQPPTRPWSCRHQRWPPTPDSTCSDTAATPSTPPSPSRSRSP
jgi:hypothetical protein